MTTVSTVHRQELQHQEITLDTTTLATMVITITPLVTTTATVTKWNRNGTHQIRNNQEEGATFIKS